MAIAVPTTWTGRVKAQAVKTGQRVSPMADQAKLVAYKSVDDARRWAAPRLENAAHRVEVQLAPAVSSMLNDAAVRVHPGRTAKSRRWPMFILVSGLAIGAAGVLFYRRNAQQWTEHMKDSASDASRWAHERSDRVSQSADSAASSVSDRADEASRKMP
ncbi:hypothetical protein ACQEUU_03750 [Nonomuraea sp. CA-218870]|uniref:hypothetical protein n=1 Tax=Nonomuraea sp. CA-218870 TaxID=3239998 RepID=UPI003D945191